MTDPTGPIFLSYKRERATEAGLLVDALRDHGVPTWQDVSDLPSDVTETALDEVLSNPATSGAVLLATPEVERSDVIRKIEVPRIFAGRHVGTASSRYRSPRASSATATWPAYSDPGWGSPTSRAST